MTMMVQTSTDEAPELLALIDREVDASSVIDLSVDEVLALRAD